MLGVALLSLVVAIAPSKTTVTIPEPVLASVTPSRAHDEARDVSETNPRENMIAQRLAELEKKLAEREEADRHDARVRDNLIQARFEETKRKINEVVGRLQIFVGCLIVLLLAIFVWLAELWRRTRPAKAVKAARVAVAAAPRSSRVG